MKFWIWGPATNWHNIESVAFFSKSLHPTEQYVTESILSCLYLVLQYVHPLCTHPVFPCICPASLLSCLMHFPCLTSLLATVQQLFFPAYFLSLTQYFLTCPKPTVLASVLNLLYSHLSGRVKRQIESAFVWIIMNHYWNYFISIFIITH